MLKIAILGAGSMGTAFSVPCSDNGHQINIIGTHLEDKFIENIRNNSNYHPSLGVSVSSKINFCVPLVRVFDFSCFRNMVSDKCSNFAISISPLSNCYLSKAPFTAYILTL